MAKNLHATTAYPNEVASPQSLEFYVGDPPRLMQIFTGIGLPNWDSQHSLDFEDVFVHFNVDAPDGKPGEGWDYTATVSLATIDAAGDNDFTFVTDGCRMLDPGDSGGELVLYTRIAVLGEPAHLRAFSYHVEVLSKIPVKGTVFGTIRWATFFGDPIPAVEAGAPIFMVGPATYSPGGLGSGTPTGWTWDEQYTIETSIPPKKVGDHWAVPYSITELPINKPLTITPDWLPNTLNNVPSGVRQLATFSPPFYEITLTNSEPSRVGLDFEMSFPQVQGEG